MSGYVDLFFTHVLDYLNLLWTAEIIKYLLAAYLILIILGFFRKLLRINR